MFVIREAHPEDQPAIFAVAKYLDSVNLPAKPEHLAKLIELSVSSFAGTLPPEEREYLFVIEDTAKNTVVGTSMIHAQHGSRRAPHIFFQVVKEERYSESLDVYKVHQALRLGYDYNGPTELAGLILDPAYRGHPESLGKLLSLSRFLFIAMHRSVFRKQIIAELLPPLTHSGTSILWQHLGRRFTGLTYQEADRLSVDNKEFIRSLFPHGLIYTALFPEEVQSVIGKVGPKTKGVEKMLRQIGFDYAHQIDPFDGGPHFTAHIDDIPLVKNALPQRVCAIANADSSRPQALIALDKDEFRAVLTRVVLNLNGALGVPKSTLEQLDIHPGQSVWYVLL